MSGAATNPYVPPVEAPGGNGVLTWLAFLVSLGVAAGSVWLTVGMHLIACPLCIYQRAFAFAALGVLIVGVFVGVRRRGLLSALALPPAFAAIVVAGFQIYLELDETLECPLGPFEIGSAPQEAGAALAALLLVLLVDSLVGGAGKVGAAAVCGAAAVGILLGVASLATAPTLVRPKAPYEVPVEKFGCRPMFKG